MFTYNFEAELISYCKLDVEGRIFGISSFKSIGLQLYWFLWSGLNCCISLQIYLAATVHAERFHCHTVPKKYTGGELTSFPAASLLSWIEQIALNGIDGSWEEFEIRQYEWRRLKKGRGREQMLGYFKRFLLYKACDANSSFSSSQMKLLPKIHCSKVLEFFGCYFNGCPSCYSDRSGINKKRSGITMHDFFATTV